jgi:hypothetical protein
MLFGEVMVPLWQGFPPNDLFKLPKQSSLVKRACSVTLVGNPVSQGFFICITEVLLVLVGCMQCHCDCAKNFQEYNEEYQIYQQTYTYLSYGQLWGSQELFKYHILPKLSTRPWPLACTEQHQRHN